MPQFAWANDPAAVEEVMTFVLGLTDERIAGQVPPQDEVRPPAGRPWLWAQGPQPVQLRRLPCPRDAQVHDPRRREGGGGLH